MKTLIAALAVTAILTASALAKTQRTKEVRIQPKPQRGETRPRDRDQFILCTSNTGRLILAPESVSSLCATAKSMKTMQSDIGFCNIRPTIANREYARRRHRSGRGRRLLKLSATTKRATGGSCARVAKADSISPIVETLSIRTPCRGRCRSFGRDRGGRADRSDHDHPMADPSQPSVRSGAVGYRPRQATAKDRRPRPDWAAVHRVLSRLG
jgi:hypothetical protein